MTPASPAPQSTRGSRSRIPASVLDLEISSLPNPPRAPFRWTVADTTSGSIQNSPLLGYRTQGGRISMKLSKGDAVTYVALVLSAALLALEPWRKEAATPPDLHPVRWRRLAQMSCGVRAIIPQTST